MSLETIQNITLDFTVPRIKNVRCVEDDHQSRIINIFVTNNGKAYPLDQATMVARYKIHKPDHTYIYNDAVINDDGTVTIPLTDQAMTVPGILHSELQISKDGKILSTMPFHIIVEKSVLSNKDIESSNESTVIQSMIDHLGNYENPHKTDKEQVGLGNVDNTSDIDKPVSTAQQAALDKKVDKTTVAASSTLGLVKSGTDITVDSNGNVSVNDNSHNHTVSNISDLDIFTQTAISNQISNHNISSSAHDDIRELISELTIRLNALADSDDITLDQLSEIVAYIKSNRSLIENITTNKVNISDIIDNLTSTNENKPLSARQGNILSNLIDDLTITVENKVDKIPGKGLSTNDYTTIEKEKLDSIAYGAKANVQADWNTEASDSDAYIKNKPTIPTKTSQLENDSGFTDNYSLPAATASVRGGVKIGYIANGKNYPVQLSNEQMYVNVPWTNTNTTYSNMKGSTTSAAGTAGLVPAPAAGSATRYLRCDGSWVVPPNTTYSAATTSAAGLMSATDKTKLDGIATGANATTIVNNLTSTSTTSALSAYQGNVLNTALAGKAASSHTHSYLPLSGGTLTGTLKLAQIADSATSCNIISTNSSQNVYFGAASNTSYTYWTYVRGACVFLYNTESGGGVYLGSSGTTKVTSDERFKDLTDIDERYEDFFLRLKPTLYKYKIGHRQHVGFGARAVEKALEESGINTEEFAGLDIQKNPRLPEDMPLSDDGTTNVDELYTLGYAEFIGLNTLMIQKSISRINKLEEENKKLREEIDLIKNE